MYYLIISITYTHTLFHTLWDKRSWLSLFSSWCFAVPYPHCLLLSGAEVPPICPVLCLIPPTLPPLLLLHIPEGALNCSCLIQHPNPRGYRNLWLDCFRERTTAYSPGCVVGSSGLSVLDRQYYVGMWYTQEGEEVSGKKQPYRFIIIAKTFTF